MTAHWIEETAPGIWELKADLLGFVSIMHSHSGKRLGQALYKVYDRIGIVKKVRHLSCAMGGPPDCVSGRTHHR